MTHPQHSKTCVDCGKPKSRNGVRCPSCSNSEKFRLRRERPITSYTIEDRGYKTPCWIWSRRLNSSGYAHIKRLDKGVLVYRLLYEQKFGPVPEGLELDHLCRVRACVNPDHLEPVTHLENALRGLRTKLSDAEVESIRALQGQMSGPKVGARFGIRSSHVYNIWHGRSRVKHD